MLNPRQNIYEKFQKSHPSVNCYTIYYKTHKISTILNFFNKIFLRRLFTRNIDFDRLPSFDEYKLICATPISGIEAGNQIFARRSSTAYKIGLISDSLLSTFDYISVEAIHRRIRILAKLKLVIVKFMKLERALLRDWDNLIVQSKKDASVLKKV